MGDNGKLSPITSKAQILEAIEPRMAVEMPEWEITVWLRSMSVADQKQIEDLSNAETSPHDVLMRVLVMSITDTNGNRMLNDDDIPALMERSAPACLRLAQEALKFNGLSEEDISDMRADFTKTPASDSDTG